MSAEISDIRGTWIGDLDQDSHDTKATFPMILTVDAIAGEEFTGTLDWPENGNTRTRVHGTLDGNVVKWTETEYLRGDDVVLGGLYIGTFADRGKIAGTWMDPKYVIHPKGPRYGTPGATFVLHRQ